ncbi:XRE family transcriptional regulator [Streptomyces sp. HF10]|uniref:XRE family transcriptional regulator n=1 Tax=Streptomyces sp. HF10 TaxID=2692233 RepID=UPI001F17446E|nr:XRE family transcriptional regulator [Streptomyces sp. HF10]
MPAANRKLKDRMRQLGYGQAELARQVSTEIELLTGAAGKVGDADVRRWLRGETKWPQDRIRLSLERVLSTPAEDLGFVPRKKKSASPKDDPMHRRRFLTSAGGSVMALGTSGSSDHGRLGIHDIRRFHRGYVTVLRHENAGRHGPEKVEDLAVELACRIESVLTSSTASTRLRGMLLRLVAEVISTAAAASIDARAPGRARMHLDRALTFAGLSRDVEATYHVWNHMFLAASQQENHAEAVAGAEVMKRSSIARRDPLYASLGHMRNANGLARLQRPSEALRALKDAERAFARADDQERAEWMGFYDSSEFDALSSFVWAALGNHGRAEYSLHRTLASIPDGMTRNRALYTAHLALSQAKQGELELACATGRQAFGLLPSPSGSQRTANTLAATRKVIVTSGSRAAEVAEWIEESGQWI